MRLVDRIIRSLKVRNIFQNVLSLDSKSTIAPDSIIRGSIIKGILTLGSKARIEQSYLHGIISIGSYTTLNGPNIDIYAQHSPVFIGKFCSIARNVSIQSHNHNFKRLSTYFVNKNLFGGSESEDVSSKGEIEIENDVWIGAHSVILSGVRIGNGAIIGANSVVSKDIPDYAIAVGSPAKVVGLRFQQSTIDLLLSTKWWDWPLEKIIINKELFNSESEEEIIRILEK